MATRATRSRADSTVRRRSTRVVASLLLLVAPAAGPVVADDHRPGPGAAVDANATLQTTITDVVPADTPNETGVLPIEPGERILVRGRTSLRGDRNTIIVELATEGNLTVVASGETRRWGTDGVWSVEMDVPENVSLGRYVVRADDGTRIARATVEVVADRDRPTTRSPTTVATTATPTATATTPLPTTTATAQTTRSTTTTTAPTPGFEGSLALVVLLGSAIALLVRTRRHD